MNEDIFEEVALVTKTTNSIITVVGVGGAGGNAVNYMWDAGIHNVRFLVCNTDQQALESSPVDNIICLGKDGLGAGNDPAEGRRAAMESLEDIREKLEAMNTHMVFITAGMGGGTGTGAAPVIAKLAREMGILTVAIVTSPLAVEGKLRYDQAMRGIDELKESVDSLLIINNENIRNLYLEDPTAMEAFSKANEILACAAKGIAEIITVSTNFVNVDFADVSKVMRQSGRAHMSVEAAAGSDRALIVATNSLTSPLLDLQHIRGAKNILLNMATSPSNPVKYSEMMTILEYIQENASVMDENNEVITANIIWGMSDKPELGDELELVLVATGFEEREDNQFNQYYLSKMGGDPGSPFKRMKAAQASAKQQDSVPTEAGPLSRGEQVILPERTHRYPNIDTLLKVPAYIARKAKLVSESTPKREDKEDRGGGDDEQLLFD